MGTETLPVDDVGGVRRHEREKVEMLARFRRDLVSTTVVLKDLTPSGARIEGVGTLQPDEVVTLTLPECRPMIAFVAWAGTHGAGLEFVHALPDDLYTELVSQYGLSSEEVTRD
ncbi:hypothetical protein A8V01_23275 [Novosphingobium guangzhouense]|uniref:PilZ domain-containing protein n=1 Tax=Novosphingobium guangzhouense TaxID=1850347 RepID=A0A2K2FXX2_9SPHN|nr:hypothetical protein A8V01_23275 [Novosphingobium guangzhouense]